MDLGVGVSRFFPGLYKKVIHGVSQTAIASVETYFNAVEKICKKFLPQCLMEKLNTIMNDIEMDDFDNVKSYKEKKRLTNFKIVVINSIVKILVSCLQLHSV